MKKTIVYLFIFSVLLNIFTYMYFTKKAKSEEDRIENFQKESKAKKDSIATLRTRLVDANYFAFETNDNAMDYFEDYDALQLQEKITNEVLSMNENPKGNPLTGYDLIGGNKTLINKIKILNHRWIIADFSAGSAWGEVLIKYFVNKDKPTDFETIETFVYASTIK